MFCFHVAAGDVSVGFVVIAVVFVWEKTSKGGGGGGGAGGA